jgi:hypothetical protein
LFLKGVIKTPLKTNREQPFVLPHWHSVIGFQARCPPFRAMLLVLFISDPGCGSVRFFIHSLTLTKGKLGITIATACTFLALPAGMPS